MQKDNTMRNVVIVSTVAILISLFYVMYNINNNMPESPVVPTAQEIADLVVIPEVVIPSIPDTRLSLRQDLKAEAIRVCDDEFDMDEVEDLFGDDDEVTLVREYVDDRNYNNINLGIDNSDDRTVNVDRQFKVEVEPDLDDDYKERVFVTCEVTSDDGDLEADLIYSL